MRLLIEVLRVLMFTTVIEILVYEVFCTNKRITLEELYAITLANIITNPTLNIVIIITQIDYLTILIVGEVLVVITESVLFKKILHIKYKKALRLSLILNIASYIVGIIQ